MIAHRHPEDEEESSRGPSFAICSILLQLENARLGSSLPNIPPKPRSFPLTKRTSYDRHGSASPTSVLYVEDRLPNLLLDTNSSSSLLSKSCLEYTQVLLPRETQGKEVNGMAGDDLAKVQRPKVPRECARSARTPWYQGLWHKSSWEVSNAPVGHHLETPFGSNKPY